jgi:hypothetical protein
MRPAPIELKPTAAGGDHDMGSIGFLANTIPVPILPLCQRHGTEDEVDTQKDAI